MLKKDYLQVFFLRWVGNFLVLSALAGVVLTFAPAIQAELTYRNNQATNVRFVVSGDSPPVNLLKQPQTVLEISPLDPNFGMIIPKIGANARIIDNVDANNYEVYIKALQNGVAHAAGSVYPGEVGNAYFFAHSVGNFWEVSRWNGVFYLLKELAPGDEIDLFYKNKRFTYVVYDKKTVEANDIQYLAIQANFPMLTLQTCWPPGTTLKRLLVFARLKSN
ncbi:sortase [Candidatus Gottesmanbacteria bacterium]|nr:sortase [Candidatus Gottesmanbacteria bacterium]